MKRSAGKFMCKTSLVFLLIGICLLWTGQPALGQSEDVVIIGGSTLNANNPCTSSGNTNANVMYYTGGGCLPVAGADLAGITFTPMLPGDVNAASLQPFDTAVLNVASYAMACDTTRLSAQAKADLMAFVNAGKKLIIYDSECYPGPVDYTWLPYPFTTANPGALGAHGTLTIVEPNTLSSNIPGDPYYIDAAHLGTATDAVGDMNVMTTYDSNWCLDMSGTNALNPPVTGPVHTYANYPSGTDKGLIIYNGLDVDYLTINDAELRKIWVFELKQKFNPSGLPCRVKVVGITLDPKAGTNEVGDNHKVTATVTDLLGAGQPGILVTFAVISGPNAGASGDCSVNTDCTTDANGQVSFTYKGDGGIGTDEIEGCFTADTVKKCDKVTKDWIITNKPPDCAKASADPGCLWPPNNKMVPIGILGVTDPDGDPLIITILSITSDEATATELGAGGPKHAPDASGVGKGSAEVRAERSGLQNGRVYEIKFEATDDSGAKCEGTVRVKVPHDQSDKSCPAVDSGQNYDATKIN